MKKMETYTKLAKEHNVSRRTIANWIKVGKMENPFPTKTKSSTTSVLLQTQN